MVTVDTLSRVVVTLSDVAAGGLSAYVFASLRKGRDVGDRDLASAFAVVPAVFSVCFLAFPLYEPALPENGYAALNIGIVTLVAVPWSVFALRYAGQDHLLTGRRIAAGSAASLLAATVLAADVFEVVSPVPAVVVFAIGLSILAVLGTVFATSGTVLLSTYRHDGIPIQQGLWLVTLVVTLVVSGQLFNVEGLPLAVVAAVAFAVCPASLFVAAVRYDALGARPGTSRLGVRAVVANMDEATFVVNTDGRIVRTNEAAQRLLGDVVNDRVGDVFDCDIETLRRRDVVENAVDHNDAPEPHVAVRGERIDRGLRVTVADDGPGIPESEREALELGAEDPLTHASSLGLWGTNWAIQTLGGTLTFGESEFGGAAVTIELPVVDGAVDS